MSRKALASVLVGLFCGVIRTAVTDLAGAQDGRIGLSRPATEAEIRAWDIDVAPTGEGLPPGQGTVQAGARLYATRCSSCHGVTGKEGPAPRLVGGQDTLATANPVKTVGSYWPYATTLYDYIRRAMPFTAPLSLTSDEVYAVTAWILAQHGIVKNDAVLDAKSLATGQMPNRNGFVSDPRPGAQSR
ncbi:MAG: c-type cytochrome [Nitrospiraceae bacterium]